MTTTNETRTPGPPKSKIPGLLPKMDSGKDTQLSKLDKYTMPELEEIRDRQKHLLANKSRLKHLPDKGERIRNLYERILRELENRDGMNKASELFSKLNIASKGMSTITNMEWHGKIGAPAPDEEVIANDDADEQNPIKLLAQSRQTTIIVKTAEGTPNLITAADLEEIKSFTTEATCGSSVSGKSSESTDLEPHAVYMCDINERHANETHRDKFLPHKTTVSNVHSVALEKSRKKPGGKHWEITAATPPQLRNAEVVTLSLHDSINIQRRQIELLKEIELKHAEERLLFRSKLAAKIKGESSSTTVESNPSSFFKSYRDVKQHEDEDNEEYEEELDSENEVNDLYDEPSGGVSCVVYDK